MIRNLSIYQELYPDAEIINCSELFRKPARRSVDSLMLSDGVAFLELCRKDGENMDSEKVYRIVIYDEKYAARKLTNDLRELLESFSLDDFLALMQIVFIEFHDNKTNG